ncbi:MAG: YeeE/YedE family protein [SAR116 cluster bacterium]|nr:YeeE/YedE family protein [Paracoccaceae bacterium]RCL81169.1 MAG: YeeE/YedE family protein [SAR116 cluster bacterium]RPH14285.1 MAG: YeeE/YedE family protein [Alphaproteobacteria bacterium TMED150]HBQ22188.1 YeeE/YedE family protein [Alphaproteobacteria bacterium]|tara:strand:+ start:37 stop:459 length:423 start_codon:yes stop_codon:yes gene_type:complete
MLIDFEAFTPMASTFGGAMIGLAALLLLVGSGRIMGASGILTSLVLEQSLWRIVFVFSLVVTPWILMQSGMVDISLTFVADDWRLWLGAFLVGVGSQLGSGCTSGHGICGLARFSKRSVVAVLTFMATAMITVFLLGRGV